MHQSKFVDSFDASYLRKVMVALRDLPERSEPVAVSVPEADSIKSSWEQHKKAICELYCSHKLEDVAKMMLETYGFQASIRGYRQRLAAWDLRRKTW